MSPKKRKAAMAENLIVRSSAQPAIEINDPGPSPCCFSVTGTSDAGAYIHVSVSENGGVPVTDPHPGFCTAGEDGRWSVSICVPPPVSAGTIIRVRACIYDPATQSDGVCTDIPVKMTKDCTGPSPPTT
jgi:hypothetical protein